MSCDLCKLLAWSHVCITQMSERAILNSPTITLMKFWYFSEFLCDLLGSYVVWYLYPFPVTQSTLMSNGYQHSGVWTRGNKWETPGEGKIPSEEVRAELGLEEKTLTSDLVWHSIDPPVSCDGQWGFVNRDETLASTSENAAEPTEQRDKPKPNRHDWRKTYPCRSQQ